MNNENYQINPPGKYRTPMKMSAEQKEKKVTLDRITEIEHKRELASINRQSLDIG